MSSDLHQLAITPPIEYVLFDMDGLLLDSERVYTAVTNEILGRYGKEMTWEIKAGLMGKPERQSAEQLLSYFPDIDLSIEEYIKERRALQDLSWPLVQPLPGVIKLIKHLHAHGIPIAVATGSQRRNVNLKIAHLLEIFDLFQGNLVCGDDLAKGKPAPDVFILAARKLGRQVGFGEVDSASSEEKEERLKGLVFEDAIAGVQAGKRAGMRVIWVPDSRLRETSASAEAILPDEQLDSLAAFDPVKWGLPTYLD